MLLSVADLQQSIIPISEVQKFLDANPSPPVDWDDVASFRAAMDAAQAAADSALPPTPDISEISVSIPMRDGFTNVAIVRKPASPSAQKGPLIVLNFGGGFCGGSNKQMSQEARALVRLVGAVVVSISYRLSPEHKFPVPMQDAWDNLAWLAEHAQQLGADPTRGFITVGAELILSHERLYHAASADGDCALKGGASAGATQAAICARKAQIEPLASPLTGQWLYAPSILCEDHVPARWKHLFVALQQNKDASVLPVAALDVMQRLTAWDVKSPWRLPLNFEHPLVGLPKAYIQANGMDPLRDDALLYDEMLREASVVTRCDFYAGTPHAHTAFLQGAEVTKKALLDMMAGFGWLLDQPVSRESAAMALGLA